MGRQKDAPGALPSLVVDVAGRTGGCGRGGCGRSVPELQVRDSPEREALIHSLWSPRS